MNVKNKTQPHDERGRFPMVEAALFCLVNEMQFSTNFFKSLEFLLLLFQDKSKMSFCY